MDNRRERERELRIESSDDVVNFFLENSKRGVAIIAY